MNSVPDSISATGNDKIYLLFNQLQDELRRGLTLYWNIADDILNKSSIRLNRPSESYFSLEYNFFSALFLYSYIQGEIPESKRILFVAVNQCLRGMVTGCDNILDNEYKQTLDTDLPANATKFRSVLDIMVSDRILVAILHKGYTEGEVSFDHILQANTASLHALLQSGVQEALEEKGAGKILKPEGVLDKIHPIKTGILFQAPWVLPELIEDKKLKSVSGMKQGLFQIGMGCQILDDMVDLSMDAQMNRHNYVASLICHEGTPQEQNVMAKYLTQNVRVHNDPDFLFNFRDAKKASIDKALSFLQEGTSLLFTREHRFMIDYSIDFFIRRIGADRFFKPKELSYR
jgi:hypothetical protein